MIGHCMNHHPIKAMIALLWLMTFSIHADAQLISAPVNNLRDEKIDTLVLCPFDFQPALAKWLTYRRGQGYQVRVESPAPIAAGIKRQIQIVAATNPLKRILLVGDSADPFTHFQQLVATDFVASQVSVFFGSEPEIATDNTYADLDFDGLPELTIGRIPVDSATQLDQYMDRVIAYEMTANRNLRDSLWRRRINLVAGVGGLGRVVDTVVEQTAKQMITDLVPAEYQTSMTYGSWASPYCPDPRRFSQTTIERFNEGCLFWVYVGHGDRISAGLRASARSIASYSGYESCEAFVLHSRKSDRHLFGLLYWSDRRSLRRFGGNDADATRWTDRRFVRNTSDDAIRDESTIAGDDGRVL